MSAFDPPDFYGLDDLLTEEQRLIRQTVREFVEERVLPIIELHNRAGSFPLELVPQMAELGMLGANLDGYGCTDLGPVGYGLINQELERGDSGLRSFVSVQSSLCMWPIFTYGSEEQKQRWLPGMAGGRLIGCFGLTEADHGSDPGGMITTARPEGDGYVLNGSKMWITNGGIADVAVVWAKLDEPGRDAGNRSQHLADRGSARAEARGSGGPGAGSKCQAPICGFLVEKGTTGYTTRDIHNKFSLRASVTSELFFDNVRLPAGSLLPGTRDLGLRGPLSCLTQARYGIAWGAVGAALACYDEARRYAQTRVQFGKPIGSFQLVQKKLAWMLTEITKAQLLILRLAQLKEAGQAKHDHVSMAKMNNVEVALKVARLTREILGAAGICDDYQCGRHLCNLESVYTYEGTHDIHTLVIGQTVTGLDAFR